MNNFETFSEKKLNNLGIRDLRKLGISIGVRGATCYSKKELIEHIIAVVCGAELPKSEKGKGRPTKLSASKKEVLQHVYNEIKDVEPVKVSSIMQNVEVFSKGDFCINSTCVAESEDYTYNNEVEGLLEIADEGYGFIRKSSNSNFFDCLIGKQAIAEYNLRRGDLIFGETSDQKAEGLRILKNVKLVNGEPPKKQRTNFDLLGKMPLDKDKYLSVICDDGNTRNVLEGESVLISFEDKIKKNEFSEFIIEKFAKSNKNILVLGVFVDNSLIELQNYHDAGCEELFYSSFDKSPEHKVKIAKFAEERFKRLIETGKRVVVIVDSISKLMSSVEYSYDRMGLPGGRFGEEIAVKLSNKMFNLAGKYGEGSLTVFALYNRADLNKPAKNFFPVGTQILQI